MSKLKFLKILNLTLFFIVLIQIIITILYQFLLKEFYILSTIHVILGYIIVIIITVHILFNFDWIKNMYFKKKG
ncbi:MAG: hypothetical protein A2355_11660 [Spirochaetes bacterium RIFOXYB1_FULL_32_8]|nr:MAG: hypothetical protein A2355_11660 [Spirochaetes bacterium RIFOXYB1_FULL_32_8]